MIDRDAFVAQRGGRWTELERLLRDRASLDAAGWSALAGAYRVVCSDLVAARSEGLSDDVVEHLDALAGRAHNALYGGRSASLRESLRELVGAVPRQVRRSWRFVLVAALLFWVPWAIGAVGSWRSVHFTSAVLSQDTIEQMEGAYGSDLERGSGEDALMAGFYVKNNVGIAFRSFATGALGGLGPVFFLTFNGVTIGAVTGHLAAHGMGWNLLVFTCGHSAWELTGIVIAGAGGLKLGWALLAPGGLTRGASLRSAAPELFLLVAGAGGMLLVAAAIEGFWSAGVAPDEAKLVFGLIQVGLVVAWLALGGRR